VCEDGLETLTRRKQKPFGGEGTDWNQVRCDDGEGMVVQRNADCRINRRIDQSKTVLFPLLEGYQAIQSSTVFISVRAVDEQCLARKRSDATKFVDFSGQPFDLGSCMVVPFGKRIGAEVDIIVLLSRTIDDDSSENAVAVLGAMMYQYT
jgi:hypothetical protein